MNRKQTIAALILGAVLIGGIVFYFGGRTQRVEGALIASRSDLDHFELLVQGRKGPLGFVIDEHTEFRVKAPNYDRNVSGLQDLFEEDFIISVKYRTPVEAPSPVRNFFATEWYLAERITVLMRMEHHYAKPVIYLYPERETVVRVQLNYDGRLTTTYPKYEDGWRVVAQPDGTLTDGKQEYRYLYWEGESDNAFDFSKGFCVPGKDSAAFLEKALASLGLNRAEANEFIVYWLPRLEAHPYNLLAYQEEAYTERAKLEIAPTPNTVIRIFLAWKPLNAPMDIDPQVWETPTRQGFTVVEWGGSEVSSK